MELLVVFFCASALAEYGRIASSADSHSRMVFYTEDRGESGNRRLFSDREKLAEVATIPQNKIYPVNRFASRIFIPPTSIQIPFIAKHCSDKSCGIVCALLDYLVGVCQAKKMCRCDQRKSTAPWRL